MKPNIQLAKKIAISGGATGRDGTYTALLNNLRCAVFQIRIDSRPGNYFIAITGVICAVAALVLLVLQVATVWDGASLFDRLLVAALLMAIIGGAVFVVIARANLRRLQR